MVSAGGADAPSAKGPDEPTRRSALTRALRWPPSVPTFVLAAIALVALVAAGAAFGPRGTQQPEASAPSEPAVESAPPRDAPDPATSEPLDAAAELADRFGFDDPEAVGIRLDRDVEGPVYAVIDPTYDRLADEAKVWLWPDHFVTPVSAVIDGEPFVEDVVVDRYPTPCHAFHRRVRGVDTGIPGEVGERMERTILERLGPFPYSYLEEGDDPLDDSWCRDVATREASKYETGFISDLVTRVDCALPTREIRCFVASRWWKEAAMVPSWSGEALVFDRMTGEHLTGAALHPGLTDDDFRLMLRLVLHTLAGVRLEPGDLDPSAGGFEFGSLDELPTLVPTSEGLTLQWLESYTWKTSAIHGIRFIIPWDVLRTAEARVRERAIAG